MRFKQRATFGRFPELFTNDKTGEITTQYVRRQVGDPATSVSVEGREFKCEPPGEAVIPDDFAVGIARLRKDGWDPIAPRKGDPEPGAQKVTEKPQEGRKGPDDGKPKV